MQLENRNTYNTLGRVGPLYPRPEYRPPQKEPAEGAGAGKEGSVRGGDAGKKAPSESLILSESLKQKSRAQKPESQGRLNAASAAELAARSSELIRELSPSAVNGCPHRMPSGEGLLYPVYA